MRTPKTDRALRRRLIEALIVALCIVGAVVLLDALLRGANMAAQILGLLVAALAVTLVQYLVSAWGRRRGE
ncbi:MAG: hypothetical protein H7Y32_19090 [Chloroflexales bacterium]|nr:hypothetical protein [Chloroflexales bacterium]